MVKRFQDILGKLLMDGAKQKAQNLHLFPAMRGIDMDNRFSIAIQRCAGAMANDNRKK